MTDEVHENDFLALYGSLRQEFEEHYYLNLPDALEYVEDCLIPGTLYDLGNYPGVKIKDDVEKDDEVVG
ncbi:MAG: hypothetical protein SXQ77_06070, partial [Halobacteria archaeon]|nr:hypothetical protein [Halobacteria archaeon]